MAEAKRGRKPIDIKPEEFQRYVTLLEEKHNFTSRNALWTALAAHPWAKHRKPQALTAQVAMLKAKQFGTVLKTPLGQRGFSKDNPPPKRSPLPVVEPPEGNDTVVHARASKGKLRMAIYRKCIDCSGGSKKEVRLCTVKNCDLYHVRPFQNRSANTCLTTSTYASSAATSDAAPSPSPPITASTEKSTSTTQCLTPPSS